MCIDIYIYIDIDIYGKIEVPNNQMPSDAPGKNMKYTQGDGQARRVCSHRYKVPRPPKARWHFGKQWMTCVGWCQTVSNQSKIRRCDGVKPMAERYSCCAWKG